MDKPAETKDAKLNRTTVEAEAARGVIPAIATLAIDTAEIGATTVLGVGADVRTELARGAGGRRRPGPGRRRRARGRRRRGRAGRTAGLTRWLDPLA